MNTQANIAKLSEYDFIIAVDASGSMSEPHSNGRNRYEHMQETAVSLCRELEKFDSDGIDIVFFGGQNITTANGVTADKVKEVFATRRPSGSTPLAQALTAALSAAGKSEKKDFIVVFTDGTPDDRAAAAKVIVEASHKQETDDALTILFVQIGNDAAATAYLTKLDDDLPGAKFDIVDVKTQDQVDNYASIADLLIDAING